jgi:hypothetical protein
MGGFQSGGANQSPALNAGKVIVGKCNAGRKTILKQNEK